MVVATLISCSPLVCAIYVRRSAFDSANKEEDAFSRSLAAQGGRSRPHALEYDSGRSGVSTNPSV